jgi:NAD(P)-dependent dehydrogenase (short-subunit alcohol dehydrogenase family)
MTTQSLTSPTLLLQNKIAVIYGAGGAIGSAIARAFARERAQVFLTGRHRTALEPVAREIISAGGAADVAEVDALDESAVGRHLNQVVDRTGRIDVSVDAVGVLTPNLGIPLLEIGTDDFVRPITAYAQTYFITARLAARRMVAAKSGVIMTISAVPARAGTPLVGGYSPAMAAKEALTRALSAELAPHGIRVVGVRPHAIPETPTMREVYRRKWSQTTTWEQWQTGMAGRTHARRLSTLGDVANAATFLASDLGAGLTGSTLNLTLGNLDD